MTFLSEIRRRIRHAEADLGQQSRDDEPRPDGPFKGLRPSQVRELIRQIGLHGNMAGREPRTKDTSDGK